MHDEEEFYSDIPQFTDKNGMQYMVSEDDYKQALDQLRPSHRKEIQLQIAKELLNSNLNRLTGRQRDVMYYKLLGYTTKRISKDLGISASAVDKHFTLAKKKLAKYIEGTREVIEEGIKNGTSYNH